MTTIFILIIIGHFIGDFFFQSHKMSINKSKNIDYLIQHGCIYTLTLIYTFCIIYIALLIMYTSSVASPIILLLGILWAITNGALHTLQDYITSKMNTWLWEHKCIHWFFTNIGLDQLIHMITLIITLNIFLL